jgi:hypothetical protein
MSDDDDDLFSFDSGAGRARGSDPDTSHDAIGAEGVTVLENKYLLALYLHAPVLSTTTIAKYWDMGRDSFSPRSVGLLELGFIECVGKRQCESFTGKMRQMQHYQLTDKGRRYAKMLAEARK